MDNRKSSLRSQVFEVTDPFFAPQKMAKRGQFEPIVAGDPFFGRMPMGRKFILFKYRIVPLLLELKCFFTNFC